MLFGNKCNSFINQNDIRNKRLYKGTYFHINVNFPDLPRVFLYIFLFTLYIYKVNIGCDFLTNKFIVSPTSYLFIFRFVILERSQGNILFMNKYILNHFIPIFCKLLSCKTVSLVQALLNSIKDFMKLPLRARYLLNL